MFSDNGRAKCLEFHPNIQKIAGDLFIRGHERRKGDWAEGAVWRKIISQQILFPRSYINYEKHRSEQVIAGCKQSMSVSICSKPSSPTKPYRLKNLL
ncbi:hypothetical protein BpHYR1_025458 [Brachionus plicatilis]|uniref:Uncharacterized protein n=1 Tax=Brachionus plicatilis TaxID=10195 RepID=A0A3M7Q0V2_BRAPC|nr:hypothetical protein BpHYR1_025458 [Brachionus plicatilis]